MQSYKKKLKQQKLSTFISTFAFMDITEQVKNSKNITEFQRKVYLELLNVPAGATISYGELARRIGCKSAQAIGQALRRNPFAPDVPCHRVVAHDGSLHGFGGSSSPEALERKRQLLRAENVSLYA